LDDPLEFSARLPAEAGSIATLRRFLAQALALSGSTADEAEATLVLSELVTNALEYGQSQFLSVVLHIDPERLRIEVSDENGNAPRIVDDAVTMSTGRGLRIVDCIAKDWGWSYPDAAHKVVWAVLGERVGAVAE
jgi:anti-sigma regulatory factor (Ser/Thr protein kinase)